MQHHPNALLLKKLYDDLTAGDMQAVMAACADNITFQVPGKSELAGKYTKENFVSGFFSKLNERAGGHFKLEIHDILANERHAAVLASAFFNRHGEILQVRTSHIWRFENGKPVAWYEYPRDLYQYDAVLN